MYNLKLIRETFGNLCKKLCSVHCKLCILDALKDMDKELLELQETLPSELRKRGITTIDDIIDLVRGVKKE